MLERFGMSKYKPRLILLSIEISLSSNDRPEIDEEKEEIKNILYYEALGLLIWLYVTTWSDLSFTMNLLFCFASNSRKAYWKVIKYILVYIKETIDYEITYHYKSSLQLIGFVNSDYANECDTRQLTDKHVFYIRGGLVS